MKPGLRSIPSRSRWIGGILAMCLLQAGFGLSPMTTEARSVCAHATLVQDALIVDGTGAPGRHGDLRFCGGMIVAEGELEPAPGEQVVDGRGLVLAPGFIDTHSHADEELKELPDALAHTSQGITTAVVSQDGGGPFPLAEWFDRLESDAVALNVAAYASHGEIREAVLGEEQRRRATAGEIEAMSHLVQVEMEAGALGLGTGLEYEPGIWSEPAEVLALAGVAARAGGRYISHVRSEDRWFWQAIDEAIEIGRQTGMPVQISHLKLALKDDWGRTDELLGKLDAARAEGIDITADVYPYNYWQSNIMVLIPSRDVEARAEYEYSLDQVAPPDGFWFTRYEPQPEYVGKTLTEIAELLGTGPVTALMQLNRAAEAWKAEHGRGAANIVAVGMTEEDVRAIMRWPHSNFCTDGSLDDGHPRGWGSYPRILGHYVREQGVLSLEEAIHKSTGLPARHMGFTRRGVIAPGMAADLVLFDPDTVTDHGTPETPRVLSSGIIRTWVNGEVVFEAGRATGRRPGKILRRGAS